MSFADIEFLVFFLPVVFALHWLLPRRAGLQNGAVLLASLAFAFTWSPRLLALLVANAALTWLFARALAARAQGARAGDALPRGTRLILAMSVVWSVGLLFVFKYLGFFAASLVGMFAAVGLPVSVPVLSFVLPVGISFWTLQVVGAQIDIANGRVEGPRSPLSWAVFVTFFPQLLAGPIPRARQLLSQLEEPRRLDPVVLQRGGATFVLGFVLTWLVAASLGTIVDPVFAEPARYGALAHWIALAGYAAQVFSDFAGYSFMAIGLGRLFGVELPENFRTPFFSRSMVEFWRRWHITLNTWLFDYLYGPLVTGRGWFRGRLDLAFVLVFLGSGLWHGAMWTFVVWGVLHGLALVVHRRWDQHLRALCRKNRVWVTRRKSRGYAVMAWALTQGFFLLSLVPFRAPTLEGAGAFAAGLVGLQGHATVDAGNMSTKVNLLICIGFLVVYHLAHAGPFLRMRDRALAAPAPIRGVAWGLVVVYLLMFMPVATGTFIYAQF